jgi:SnoaL-like domain
MTRDQLIDRAEIHDLIVSYATAAANRDYGRYRSCFAADATCDFSSTGGPVGDLDTVVGWLEPTLANFDALQFIVSNIAYCFDGADRCGGRVEFQTVMRLPGDKPMFIRAGGHYDDVYVRATDGWRIAERIERFGYLQM